ncbi:carbohydrate ABC transporter permease [Chitinimonas koreensis]|uniref:carbohydrate ABC transporter permease n=1 Tax=Chitinimonas koreensis TaxID=356302 RepID=UPI00223ED42E|nr:hypothetical protein [Chitinimonas koreensis]
MKRHTTWHLVVFLAPACLIYTAFSAYPLLDTLRQGFYATSDSGQQSWAGLANYLKLLTDPQWSDGFWNAMANNLKFFLIHLCVQNPIGLMLAALLSLKGVKAGRPTGPRCSCRPCCRW